MTDPKQRFDLGERAALVTGGTRGLGRAIAKGLAQAGARVAITGRTAEACEAAAKQLRDETGAEILPVACHMGDWEALPDLVETMTAAFGTLDVLINNAGINPATLPITEISEAYFDKLYDVNVKGPMRLAALAAPVMAANGGGSIVNVITVGAYSGGPGQATYTSAKAALLTLTKCMAQEWASHAIRVNALAPGPFMTDMMKGTAEIPGFLEGAKNATLQQRIAEPEEIVGAALFLASDASSYMTGEDLVVAGGFRK